jgi:hypothetical protein
MSGINESALREYINKIYPRDTKVLSVNPLMEGESGEKLKEYGYGIPLQVDLIMDGSPKSLVVSTIKPGGFGHETMPDRASIILRQYQDFNALPRHVEAIDVGVITSESIKTVGDPGEFFLVTEKVEGTEYYRDLDKIREEGEFNSLDLKRCESLARYLSEIHSVKHQDPGYYKRRIRELIGDHECIFGIIDGYPDHLEYIKSSDFALLEKRCIDWRWRINNKDGRLSQVHGDFHPWNILFRGGTDFTILDRSRGKWGEPADDLAAMTINYLFYALLEKGTLKGPFLELWNRFFKIYLHNTGDWDILDVISPFYTFRGLVIASPVWYPNLPFDVRKKLLNFSFNILNIQRFDPTKVDSLLEASF